MYKAKSEKTCSSVKKSRFKVYKAKGYSRPWKTVVSID